MKRLFPILAACCLLPSFAADLPPALDKTIPEPPFPEVMQPRNDPGQDALATMGWMPCPLDRSAPPPQHLLDMLRQGKLELFYRTAHKSIMAYGNRSVSSFNKKQYREMLWACYLTVAAPMYQVDFSGKHVWRYIHNCEDSRTKLLASSALSRIVNEQNAQRLGVDRKKIAQLSALYSAAALKAMRREYDNTAPELIAKRIRNADKKVQTLQIGSMRSFMDHQEAVAENRHGSLKPDIKWVEDDLIKILIRYFPGRTAEARQYIRKAGYEDKEINDLVNRTAGRNADSEFLYKGRGK